MFGFVWFVVMGGIVGWIASLIMRRDSSMGVLLNIIVGIAGSFLGNTALSLITGGGTIGAWPPDWSGVAGALLGAVVLLAIVNLVQRGRLR